MESTTLGQWTPRSLATGLEFPEGPVAMPNGDLVFTQIRGQCLSRLREGKVETLAHTGGGANGATVGADGSFYVANNGGISVGPHGHWFAPEPIDGRIQRVSPDGMLTDIAVALPGAAPHRPNDLCFGPDGLLYFTDPHNWEDLAKLQPGRVNRTTLDGKVEQLASVALFPNGIGFGPDDRLYVAESVTQHIWVYDWTPRGLGEARVFCKLERGYPDGFCFSVTGDLIVCGSLGDTIYVFDSDGKQKHCVQAPEGTEPTNCCIADGQLFVTLSGVGELVAFDYPDAALPLYPERSHPEPGPR